MRADIASECTSSAHQYMLYETRGVRVHPGRAFVHVEVTSHPCVQISLPNTHTGHLRICYMRDWVCVCAPRTRGKVRFSTFEVTLMRSLVRSHSRADITCECITVYISIHKIYETLGMCVCASVCVRPGCIGELYLY
jgi:hypothetical protein